MSEPRRVAFTTISSNVSQGTLSAAASGSGTAYRAIDGDNALMASKTAALFGGSGQTVDGSENRSKHNKTFRLELTLFQTDSSKYPEFDYSRLVHLEKKKLKKLKTRINGFTDDPFDNGNDDEVAKIARELEKKYGSSYGSGRSRNRQTTANDKAIGYDETDSFIDNTEAFDEILPEEVETLEGGFYINCGALEFKKLHTEQLLKTKTDEIIKMPNRPKKRELSTSSSDDTSTTDEDDEADDDEEEADEEEGDDSSTTNNRQKSGNSSSSTTTSVNTKKSAASANKNVEDKKQIILSSSSNSPKEMIEELGSDSDKDRVPVKTTTVKEMLKAKRDNFLKNQISEEKTNSNGAEKINKSTDDEDEDSTSSTGESEDSDDSSPSLGATETEKNLPNAVVTAPINTTEENTKKQEVKLPAGLSANLIELLNNFKETALSKGLVGKKFQFDDRTTEQFLKIDNILITLDKATRNLVLAHLEYHLQLRKYYLLRKEKQFHIKEEKQKNKRALAKLKKCVIEIMPTAIAEYEVELRKYADLNAANMNADQPPIMPKKEFPWNNNLSNLLYEVYEVRLASYGVLRTRKETFEEFINEYLRSKVLALWPNGWLRIDDLLREIEKVKLARSKIIKPQSDTNMPTLSQTVAPPSDIPAPSATSTTPAIMLTVPTANKRKHADGTTKPRKNKSQKKTHSNNPNELATSNKKFPNSNATDLGPAEFSINLQQQKQNQTTVTMQNTTAPAFSGFQQHHQQQKQQQQTHSIPKPAHIIDLDNYKSANDILQTSKQIINAAQQQHQQQVGMTTGINYKTDTFHVQESGSESDGVEIVGVYQNRPVKKNKQKTNKNVDPLLINFPVPLNLNNNNNNNNYNKKNPIKLNMDTILKDSKKSEQISAKAANHQ